MAGGRALGAVGLTALLGADPASYVPHAVHAVGDRVYVETNCYSDVVVELSGLESALAPAAGPMTVRAMTPSPSDTALRPARSFFNMTGGSLLRGRAR